MQEKNSQNAIKIIERLKKSLKIKTDIELSEFLSIRPNTISTWKKRNSVDYDSIIAICELYEIDLNKIFLDKTDTASYSATTALVCREMQFQYSKEDDVSALVDILPKYNFPFVTAEKSRAFQVTSNNMFPVIDENTFVICEQIEIDSIVDNSIVVLISAEKGLFINRIVKDEQKKGQYFLKSENDFFREITIDKKEIKEIWNVCGVLSYDINNQNKFKFINDSLKTINKFIEQEKAR
ncbi:helix-turn-helix domain-containing protein [Flavobacterium qiangtangense]|uniref:Helix-turn-helix domain-containing protein n=1 Tax=Flavobacterium qiangtangense TaxID=1442595 RepID=A0ABW1PKX1_9FLAO